MRPRQSLVRIEQSANNTLSLAHVYKELTRPKPKHFSAFSFQAFSMSSFEEVMEEDGVLEPTSTPGAEVIDHAVNQIALRTTLVAQMTTETRKESAAVLAAAQAEMKPARARKRSADAAAAGLATQPADDEAECEALVTSWRTSLERLQRVVQGLEEGKAALHLERLCPRADEASAAARPRAQTKGAQWHALSASASGLAPPRVTDCGVGPLLRWEAEWEAQHHDPHDLAEAVVPATAAAPAPADEGAHSAPRWVPWRAAAEADVMRELASLPAGDDAADVQPPAIAAPPRGVLAAAAPPSTSGALPPAIRSPSLASSGLAPPHAAGSGGSGQGSDDQDGGASESWEPAVNGPDSPSAMDGFEATPDAETSDMELSAVQQMPEECGGGQPALRAAADPTEAPAEGSNAAGGLGGRKALNGAHVEGELSDDNFEDPQPRTRARHPALRQRVISDSDDDDERDRAPPLGPDAAPRQHAAATLGGHGGLQQSGGGGSISPVGGSDSCSHSARGVGGGVDHVGLGELVEDVEDEALAPDLGQPREPPAAMSIAPAAPPPHAPRPAAATAAGSLLVDLLAAQPTSCGGGGGGGRGKEPARKPGSKPRPFAMKRSPEDNLLGVGAAPTARPKQAAQRHPLVGCLVAGPKGRLSYALPAAAAALQDRGAMFRSLLSRNGDALAWMELRHQTSRWKQSVPLTPADDEVAEEQQVGGAGERGETAAALSEAAVDGRSVEDHAASALDALDEWGGAEAWPAPAEHEDVEVMEVDDDDGGGLDGSAGLDDGGDDGSASPDADDGLARGGHAPGALPAPLTELPSSPQRGGADAQPAPSPRGASDAPLDRGPN